MSNVHSTASISTTAARRHLLKSVTCVPLCLIDPDLLRAQLSMNLFLADWHSPRTAIFSILVRPRRTPHLTGTGDDNTPSATGPRAAVLPGRGVVEESVCSWVGMNGLSKQSHGVGFVYTTTLGFWGLHRSIRLMLLVQHAQGHSICCSYHTHKGTRYAARSAARFSGPALARLRCARTIRES